MKTDPFFDTNILIYSFARGDHRWKAARELLSLGGLFSVQVANEFVDVSRRKHGWSWDQVSQALDAVRLLLGDPLPVTYETHARGLVISARYGFRIYDSLVLGAASLAGCRTLLSEDSRHGQVIDGVRIENPSWPDAGAIS